MILRLITQNFGWKLFALAASFAIWMNVASEPDLATIVTVPVEYSNFPRGLEISSVIQDTVSVEARGPAIQMRSLGESKIPVVLDFSSVTDPGVRTFALASNEIRLPRGTQLLRTIPSQLRFRFEKTTTRDLPVGVVYSGALPKGLSLAKVEVTPPELEIAGPESHVQAARNLVSDPFDLSRVTGDGEQTLSVYSAEPQVRFSGMAQVTVKVWVKSTR